MRLMPVVVIGLALALAQSASSLAETRSPLRAALVEYGSEVGASAYMFGSCERFVPREDADEIAASFSGADTHDEFAREIAAVFARMYGLGRKDAAKNDFTADQCTRLLSEAAQKIAAAKAEV